MMVALAALEAGRRPPPQVFCPGHIDLGDARFHCWKKGGHGTVDMSRALKQSCDVYFYELARRIGIDRIAAMAAALRARPAAAASTCPASSRADPEPRLEAGDPRRSLAAGRDAGRRHRPGLRAGDAAAARRDGGAAGQWRLARQAAADPADRARQPASSRHSAGRSASPRPIWTSCCDGMTRVMNEAGGTAFALRIDRTRHGDGRQDRHLQVRRITMAERSTGVRKNDQTALGQPRPRAVRRLRADARAALCLSP